MIISCLATYFLELGIRFSLKVATKVFLDVKHLLKLRFLDYFSKAETEACYQKYWSFSKKLGIITPCSATCHLEVGAPISMKVATIAYLRGKKAMKI